MQALWRASSESERQSLVAGCACRAVDSIESCSWATLAAALVLVVGCAASSRTAPETDSITCSLESLNSTEAKILWRDPEVYRVWAAGDLLLQNRSSLRSVEPLTGSIVWEHSYELHEAERLPAVSPGPDWIALGEGDESIRFLDRATGSDLGVVDLGAWIYDLVGWPLVAILAGPGDDQSSLVRFDENREIAESRVVPACESWLYPVVSSGVVALVRHLPSAGRDENELVGFSLDSLEELWTIGGFTFNTQEIDGLLYVGDIFWSKGAAAIDVSTGEVLRQVPPRDPYSMGGSGDFDLQVVRSEWSAPWNPREADCEELRRNDPLSGSTRWIAPLPFRVLSTLRDGGTLFVAGRHDPEHTYLVALDLESGRLLRAWSEVPLGGTLKKRGEVVYVFELARELAAVDVSEIQKHDRASASLLRGGSR